MSMSDMSGMTDMSSTNGTMIQKMYLHASLYTDNILFASWMPTSPGAVAGACIGLFVFALFGKFLAAVKRGAEGWFRIDALRRIAAAQPSSPSPAYVSTAARPSSHSSASSSDPQTPDEKATDPVSPSYTPAQFKGEVSVSGSGLRMGGGEQGGRARAVEGRGRRDLPFVWRNELSRGGLEVATMIVQYSLMLVVMTFNIPFIVSILAGHGLGEILFGRHGH